VKIYGDLISGNCYKIKLLCSLLGIGHEWIAMDIMAGDCRKPVFLQKTPTARYPCWSSMTVVSWRNRMPYSATCPLAPIICQSIGT